MSLSSSFWFLIEMAVKRASSSRRFLSSRTDGSPQPVSNSKSHTSKVVRDLWPRAWSPFVAVGCGSVGIGTDHLPVAAATQSLPSQQVNRLPDEPNGAVPHQHVGAAGVQRVELVGVTEGAVRRVDHLRALPERYAAVGRKDGAGVIVVDLQAAGPQAGKGVVGEVPVAGNDPHPTGIGQIRRLLTREDRVAQSVGHPGVGNVAIPVERTVISQHRIVVIDISR